MNWLFVALMALTKDLGRDAEAVTLAAIAEADARPLFAGADGARRTAALLGAVAWYESRLTLAARGKSRDCGPYQHVAATETECVQLATDVAYATRVARDDIARSIAACGTKRALNVYARGTCERGQGVTDSRMAMARRILEVAK